ncbi:MAG: OsmC family protein [Anaerolineae bacterium]|jgi:putative redox protein|nr:OsmC family protein [Anaerolineae bacterium]
MGKAIVTWLQDLQFVGTDSTKHSVVLSSPDEANGTGMKPSELLLISLGGCTAFDVANILQKQRKHITHLQVEIESQQQSEPPWPYTDIHLHYVVTGQDISARDVDKAIRLSHEKYCSVSATLRPSVNITHDFEIIEPDGAGG